MVQQLRQPHKIYTSLHSLSYLKYYKQLENLNIFPIVNKNWAVVFTERVKIQNESRYGAGVLTSQWDRCCLTTKLTIDNKYQWLTHKLGFKSSGRPS